jgi:hypothetical protein
MLTSMVGGNVARLWAGRSGVTFSCVGSPAVPARYLPGWTRDPALAARRGEKNGLDPTDTVA